MRRLQSRKASSLITVIMLTAVMATLSASLLKYSVSERRFNERQRLILRSRNMAENVAVYASEQITSILYKLRSFGPRRFQVSNNTSDLNALTLPPDDVLITPFSNKSDVGVAAGLTYTSVLTYMDPTAPANANNPNAGLQIQTSTVPIIAKSTMTHTAVGSVTTYAQQELEVSIMPLFQFAIFYNMDLEFGPGPNMTISGPVHTNGDFISRIQSGFSNTIRFTDRVTAAKGFYANTGHRGPTYMADGSVDNGPGGTGPLIFRKPTEAVTGGTEIKDSSGVWRDHKWSSSSTPNSVAETATSLTQFKNFATNTYAGNLRTSVHGVTKLVLPSIGDYDESTPEGRKNGRQIIDPPFATDQAGIYGTKFARNAGLYIVVNPDNEARTAYLPSNTSVSMRARSYRAWLQTNHDNSSHSFREVVLPGQPSYGPNNATINGLPNAYRVDTSIGSNQVLRIPQGGGVDLAGTGYAASADIPVFSTTTTDAADAYFYDIRRAFNNTGATYDRSSSKSFRPRPIAKIDFDMVRFKLAVERTLLSKSTVSTYNPDVPRDHNWSANVLNSSASPADHNLGLSTGANTTFSDFPDHDTIFGLGFTQAGNYFPQSIVARAWTQSGTATPTAYSNYFIFYETQAAVPPADNSPDTSIKTGWKRTWKSSSAQSTSAPFTPRAGTTFVKVALQNDDSETNEYPIDIQVIPVTPSVAPLAVVSSDENNDGTPDNARFIIAETTSSTPLLSSTTWTTRYTSSANETGLKFTPSNATVTAVRVRQYAAGGTSTLIREQVIPLAVAVLSNTRHTLPRSSFSFHNAKTEMRVYVGGIDDTDNWTFSATTSGSLSGSLGSGRWSNRYSATGLGITSNEGKVTIKASKIGFPDLTRDFVVVRPPVATGLLAILSALFNTLFPDNTGRWLTVTNSVAPDPFKIYFADSGEAANVGNFVTSGASPWFDGVTVYIHSVGAEITTTTGSGNNAVRNRVDSGVRLWNGRGRVVSLPGATYAGRTGFSIATNDPIYIMGHFNADGSINSTLNSTGTGGYSGRYPESVDEMLTSVMGDAINIFSQPQFTQSGSRYYQSSGWADSLSRNRELFDQLADDKSGEWQSARWDQQ
jgi:hypothetical protein